MTFGEKLKKARKEKGLTQKALADMVGAKHNSISNWEANQNKPDPNTIELLCGVLEITPNYLLMSGSAGVKKNTPSLDGLRIGRLYDKAEPPHKQAVELILKPYDTDNGNKKAPSKAEDAEIAAELYIVPDSEPRKLPLSLLPASAGTGVFLDGNLYDEVEVDSRVPDSADFGVRISGNSMEPDYPDGHIAWIETAVNLRVGEVGLFVYDNNGYIKELGDGELISHNEEHGPIELHEELRLDVIGRVVAVTE